MSNDKRQDGASFVPWKGSKVFVWDVTCPNTLAPSHASLVVKKAGAVATDAEYRKTLKYGSLSSSYSFIPSLVETLKVFRKEAHSFLKEVAQCTERNWMIIQHSSTSQSHSALSSRSGSYWTNLCWTNFLLIKKGWELN